MLKSGFGLVLSFVITSWLYAECMLLFPALKPVAKKVVSTITIPTHDQWEILNNEKSRFQLETDINNFVKKVGFDIDTYQPAGPVISFDGSIEIDIDKVTRPKIKVLRAADGLNNFFNDLNNTSSYYF